MPMPTERQRRLYRAGQSLLALSQGAKPGPDGCAPRFDNNAGGLEACGYLWTGCRVYGLPVDSGVAIGVGVTFALPPANPTKPFLPQLFSVPDDRAPSFLINNIEIGTNGQLVAAGAQSAVVYSDVSVNNLLNLDPCGPGVPIVVTVTNIGLAPLRFLATFFGTALAA